MLAPSSSMTQCPICEKHLLRDALPAHAEIHYNQDYSCNICDRVFPNIALLVEHESRLQHPPSIYYCVICSELFPNELGLKVHMYISPSWHPKCRTCSSRFSSYEALHAHAWETEPWETQHEFHCEICCEDDGSTDDEDGDGCPQCLNLAAMRMRTQQLAPPNIQKLWSLELSVQAREARKVKDARQNDGGNIPAIMRLWRPSWRTRCAHRKRG